MKKVGDGHHRRRQQHCRSQSFLFPGSLGFPATSFFWGRSFDLVVQSITTATKLLDLLLADLKRAPSEGKRIVAMEGFVIEDEGLDFLFFYPKFP